MTNRIINHSSPVHHRAGDARLCVCPTKQSVLLVWSASVFASLLLLLSTTAAATIGHVNITWHDAVDSQARESIESNLGSSEGAILTEERINRILESLLAQLEAYGHFHATVSPRDFHSSSDSLKFTIDVTAGPRARIVKWELVGLARTDSVWLAKALALPVGAWATSTNLSGMIERLSAFTHIQLIAPPEIVDGPDDSSVVINIHLRESTPTRLEGAIAAGSSDGADQALLGRFTLGLQGLFRRGHALDIQYEHPQPRERLLRLDYAESRSIWGHLSSGVSFEDWRRGDHRQRIRTQFTLSPHASRTLSLFVGANWQKIVPLQPGSDAARLYESSAGMLWKRGDALHASLAGTYSVHRQWGRSAGSESSQSRLRFDSEGEARFDLSSRSSIGVLYGARLWGGEDNLHIGDEWFLGGDVLRGYSDRSIAAASGVWSRMELSQTTHSGFGASLFGELAWLSMFDDSYTRPATVGLALLLESSGRSGRLELAWKDHATLSDGILRLSVIQGW